MDSTRDDIKGFIRTELARDLTGVREDDSLLQAGIIDSMAVLQLIGFIETRYGFTVSEDEMMPDNFDSIEAIVTYISRRRNG